MTENESHSMGIRKNTEQLNEVDKRIHKLEINWRILIILAAILVPSSGWFGIQLVKMVNKKSDLEHQIIQLQEKLKPTANQYNILAKKIQSDINQLHDEYKAKVTGNEKHIAKRFTEMVNGKKKELTNYAEEIKNDMTYSLRNYWERNLDLFRLPVGSIIAWHNIDNLQKPPEGWVKCNGQVLNLTKYKRSPFYKKVIPNLNNEDGGGRYLRGTSGKSGVMQSATFHPLVFPAGLNQLKYPNIHLPILNTDSMLRKKGNNRMTYISTLPDLEIEKATCHYYTSRPISMTIIWILKVSK